jgi:hypothetical protein
MSENSSGKFQIGGRSGEVEAWRPKVMVISEETKQALAELNSVRNWAEFRELCEQQRIKRERGGR